MPAWDFRSSYGSLSSPAYRKACQRLEADIHILAGLVPNAKDSVSIAIALEHLAEVFCLTDSLIGYCRCLSAIDTREQEAASRNIRQLEKACQVLSEGNITDALKALYRVDNNMYAFLFDEEVYYHFTEYILHQPKDRLMWGAGRIMHHENLYGIVQKLKQRLEEESPELDGEIRRLEAALRRQRAYYNDDIRYVNSSVSKLSAMFNDVFNSPIL